MSVEKRYRCPVLTGTQRKRLVLATAFVLPLLAAAVCAPILPEWKQVIAILAVGISVLSVCVLGLLMRLSTSFVLEVDKLSKWGILRRGPELAFDAVASVVSVPAEPTGGLVTLLFTYDVSEDDPFGPRSEAETRRILPRMKQRVGRLLRGLAGGSHLQLSIPSHTEHYPELVEEISRRSSSALVDPFTRMIAGFSFPTLTLDQDYERRTRARWFPGVGDLDSARLYLSRFELGRARRRLQRLTSADPRDADAWHLLGMAYLLCKQMEGAAKALEEAAALRPSDADIRFHLGIARFYAGEFDEARTQFQTALELRPDDPTITSFFGCVSRNIGAWKDGLSAFRRLEKQSSGAARRSARECFECTDGAKELVDQGRAPSVARKTKILGYIASALLFLGGLAQGFLRDIGGGGAAALVLAGLAAVAIAYVASRLSKVFSPGIRAAAPCWPHLGWMKADVAARPLKIDQAASAPAEASTEHPFHSRGT